MTTYVLELTTNDSADLSVNGVNFSLPYTTIALRMESDTKVDPSFLRIVYSQPAGTTRPHVICMRLGVDSLSLSPPSSFEIPWDSTPITAEVGIGIELTYLISISQSRTTISGLVDLDTGGVIAASFGDGFRRVTTDPPPTPPGPEGNPIGLPGPSDFLAGTAAIGQIGYEELTKALSRTASRLASSPHTSARIFAKVLRIVPTSVNLRQIQNKKRWG